MKDECEYVIRCKWSELKVIDEFMNHEFVCTYGGGHFCFAEENCKHYEPVERKEIDDSKKK